MLFLYCMSVSVLQNKNKLQLLVVLNILQQQTTLGTEQVLESYTILGESLRLNNYLEQGFAERWTNY